MQWIKENSIITITIFISLLFHSIIMLYNKEEHIIKENIITFEIVKQVANTQIAQEVQENTDTIQSAGVNKINNQAETYIKQNYNQIRQEIVSRIVYPPRAKKLGIEGSGYLLIAIDKTGTIVSVKAFDFPNKLLQDAALKAAKKVGYVAGHEMVSNVELKVPVTFYLR